MLRLINRFVRPFFVIWSSGNIRNSWTRNWICLNTGETFHIRACYVFGAKGQGSICVPITSPEMKIIISLGGEKRPVLMHCSQTSSFIKSRLNIWKAKWLPNVLTGVITLKNICPCVTWLSIILSLLLFISVSISLWAFIRLHYFNLSNFTNPCLLFFFSC